MEKIRVKVRYGANGSYVDRADGNYNKKDYADLRYGVMTPEDLDLVLAPGKKPSQICRENDAEFGTNALFAWLDNGIYKPIGNVVKDEKLIQTTATAPKWAEFILAGRPYIGQLDIKNVQGIKLAFSSTPQIVREGKIFVNSWAEATPADVKANKRSKTGLGITKDGNIILAVLDQGPYDGPMRIDEFALCLIHLGAWEAINLDGGGSCSFWADGKVQNYQAKTYGERPTGSALICRKRVRKALGIYVSPHFKDTEFACKDGSGVVMIHPDLPPMLEKLRSKIGKPIYITSGYRTPTYNAKVGGAKDSYHLRGMAVDIRVPGRTPQQVADAARKLGFGGIGVYSTFTHVDVGPVRSWKG